MLDNRGLEYVRIFASGDLDEFKIAELLKKDAKIDAFGVGTKMGTSADRPYVDVIYKLSEITSSDGIFSPVMKLSKGKVTLPGRKQVFRFKDQTNTFQRDLIGLADEKTEGDPLLIEVVKKGEIIYDLPSLAEIRTTATKNLSSLPAKYKELTNAPKYTVEISKNLKALVRQLKIKLLTI